MNLSEAQKILNERFIYGTREFDKKKVKHFGYTFIRHHGSGFSGLDVHFYFLEEGVYFTRMLDQNLQYLGDSDEILSRLIEEKEKLENEITKRENNLIRIYELLEVFRLEVLFLSKKNK
jgi:hypothetical protein